MGRKRHEPEMTENFYSSAAASVRKNGKDLSWEEGCHLNFPTFSEIVDPIS